MCIFAPNINTPTGAIEHEYHLLCSCRETNQDSKCAPKHPRFIHPQHIIKTFKCVSVPES